MGETNPLSDFPEYEAAVKNAKFGHAAWTEPDLKIIRLRLISDPGFPMWDVSYCHGQRTDGEFVHVGLPFHQLRKVFKRKNRASAGIAAQIIEFARQEDPPLFAKGTGILDAISTLV